MVKKNIDPKILKIIKQYAKVVTKKWPIDQVILFGSQAKGNTHKWSDIDLCLTSKQFGKDFFDEKWQLRCLTDQISTKIEPTPLHPSALLSKYDTLAHEIRTHGIEIKI